MPKVPVYDSVQASPGEAPGGRFAQVNANIPNSMPTGAGEIVNKQIGQLGAAMEGAGGKAASILADMEERQSRTEAKAADVQAVTLMNDTQFNPQTGYMTMEGKNAVDALPDAEKALTKIGADVAAGLSNNRARSMFDEVFQHRQLSAIESMRKHAAGQNQKWQVQTSEDRAVVTLQDAASQPDNPEVFESSLGTAIGEAQSQGKLHGWGDDSPQTKLQAQKYTDMAFKMRYDAWRLKDPVSALGDFMTNAQRVSPLSRENIGRDLFHAAAPGLAEQLNATGGAGSLAPPAIGGADQPRGVRNNNPGNIMRSDTPWQGEVTGNDPRYASFETPEAGVRAIGKTLLTYQDTHGINTVQDIVARWAPATENNTASYVASVSKAMGVNPTQPLDLHDPATLTAITKSIIQFENGKQPYTDQQIASGIAAATGNGSLPTPPKDIQSGNQDTALTGNALIDALPSDWRIHVFNVARVQGARDRSMAQEQLKVKVQDAQTSYMVNGDAPNPPHEVDFIQAYGQGEGTAQYRRFQDVARLGQQIQQINTLPVSSIAQLVTQAKPVPGEGFDEKQHNYEILLKSVEQVQQARNKDPIAYAISTGSYGIKPITTFSTPAVMMQELARRGKAMDQLSRDYDTPQVLLTKQETDEFGRYVDSLQAVDKARVLGQVFDSAGPAGLQTISIQLKDKNDELSIAGALAARTTTSGRNAAQLYLEGKEALHEKRAKIDAAAETGVKAEIYKAIDGVYTTPQGRDAAAEAAFGIYAKLESESNGDVPRAVRIATGGIMNLNGWRVAKPYGWADDKFSDALKTTVPAGISTQGGEYLANGKKISAADVAKMLPGARLQTYGDGAYLVKSGSDVLRRGDGRPFVLKVGP